jgi:hypothetical protein
MNPISRRHKLLVAEIADEIVVLDQVRNRAHRLNRTAALVWQNCDGRHTVEDLSLLLQQKLELEQPDERVVRLALKQLRRLQMVDLETDEQEQVGRVSRRDLVRKLALGAAMLPLITSITVPTPARAASGNCRGQNDNSQGNNNCQGQNNNHQ